MVNHRLRNVLNEFAYTITVITAVFFMIERFIYPVLSILGLILCYLLISTNGKFRCPAIVIIFISYGAVILVQMIIEPSIFFNVKIATKELSRLCTYTLVVLIAANTCIREERFLRIWRLVFVTSVVVAILQFAKIESLNKMLIGIYGDSRVWDLAMRYSTLGSFRAGSVFTNPNTYAKFILAILAIFLAIDQRRTNSVIYATVFSLIVAASLLLTGSRTGSVIASLMVMGFYLRSAISRKGRFMVGELLMLVLLVLLGAMGIAIYHNIGADGSGGVRALQIVAGFGNSVAYKLETFRNMVDRFTATNILVGMGPFETDVKYLTLIDFDVGHLVTFYGAVGCVLYVCMLWDICRYRRHLPARYSYFNGLLASILVLFGLTGGMFLHLRIFTIFAAMLYVGIVDEDFRPIQEGRSEGTAPF